MPLIQVDVDTLKRDHPDEFARTYQDWVANSFHHDWWDGVYDVFIERMQEFGVEVSTDKRGAPCIYFSLGYSQSDYAAFEANVKVADWMRAMKLDEQYLALVLDMEEYGATAKIDTRGYSNYSYVASVDYWTGNTAPVGIFGGLSQEAWEDLTDEQANQCEWEKELPAWASEQCQQLYRDLQEEYEYQTSEEQFIEWARANEDQFDVEIEDEAPCED